MTQREIARLCCKIISIYALIRSIESLQVGIMNIMMFSSFFQSSGSIGLSWYSYVGVFFSSATPVLLAAVAIFFWRQSGIIAAWITGHNLQDEPDEPDSNPKRISAKELQVVAFATIGLWAIVSSLSQLLSAIAWMAFSTTSMNEEILIRDTVRVIGLLFVLCLGFWLLFGARGIVQLLYKLRNVGLDENERP